MIKDFYKNNYKLSGAIGLFLGFGTIGYALAPCISTYLVKILGEEKYSYIGIFGIILSCLMLFFVPKINNIKKHISFNFLEAAKEIVSNKLCMFLILITIVKASLVMLFGTYIPFLLKRFDFSMVQIGFIITLFYIAGGLSMIIAPKFEKYLKLRKMIVTSYVPLLPLTLLFLYFLNFNKTLAVITLIIIGFFILFSAGTVLACAQSTANKHVGIISGIIQGFTLAIGSLLLIPFGYLGQNFGEEYVLITISSFAFILSIFTLKFKTFKSSNLIV